MFSRNAPGGIKPPPFSCSSVITEEKCRCQSACSHGHYHGCVAAGDHAGERVCHAYLVKVTWQKAKGQIQRFTIPSGLELDHISHSALEITNQMLDP